MNCINHGVHICIFISKGNRPSFTTDDYELFDLIDDFLTETCDFNFECFIHNELRNKTHFTMEIESGVTFEELVTSIKKLDLREIENIYKVNN
ncbi:hypothetical protein V6237_01650 [Pseudoalteromonas carrageenovora]|uniref:hypothetical protein n=1 Tax=Pseudoalteromonas carrageenovora TaxID=227 RepID=UPI00311D3D52